MKIFQSCICWCLLCARLSLFLATLSYSFYSIVILKSEVIQRHNIMYVHVTQLHAFINVLKLNITARF